MGFMRFMIITLSLGLPIAVPHIGSGGLQPAAAAVLSNPFMRFSI
jgi:hypothetical protein